MILFSNIYDENVADAGEGSQMLKARAVAWPTNKQERDVSSIEMARISKMIHSTLIEVQSRQKNV